MLNNHKKSYHILKIITICYTSCCQFLKIQKKHIILISLNILILLNHSKYYHIFVIKKTNALMYCEKSILNNHNFLSILNYFYIIVYFYYLFL